MHKTVHYLALNCTATERTRRRGAPNSLNGQKGHLNPVLVGLIPAGKAGKARGP